MFDTDKLFDLLASGHSSEDIAALFASSLNDAEARIRAQEEERKRQEAADRARAEAAANRKREDMRDIVSDFFDFMDTYYADALGVEPEDINNETIASLADMLIMVMDLEAVRAQAKSVEAKKCASNTADEVFADFFKAFGLS